MFKRGSNMLRPFRHSPPRLTRNQYTAGRLAETAAILCNNGGFAWGRTARPLSTTCRSRLGADPARYPLVELPKSPILRQPVVTELEGGAISIEIEMGIYYPKLTFNTTWLRDNCRCSQCVNPDSGQKTFATVDVARRPEVETIDRTPDSGLRVVWANGGMRPGVGREGEPHESFYPFELLATWAARTPPQFSRYRQWPTEWQGSSFDPLVINYSDWMEGGEGFVDALLALNKTGIVFIRDVPREEHSVVDVATKVGHLQETFYGRTWDVRSKPHAENVAYTNEFLGLHQDLMYMAEPPRIQALHCIDNNCTGGESLYSDARSAARRLTISQYRLLERYWLMYGYDRNGHYYQRYRPVFSGDFDVDLTETKTRRTESKLSLGDVNGDCSWMLAWSPPFQIQEFPPWYRGKRGNDIYGTWHDAATAFQQYLESPEAVYEYKMKPGDCVLFDNWRIVHGRRQFDTSSGKRWLKGTYIGHQAFESRVRLALREREMQGKWQIKERPRYPRLEGGVPDVKPHIPNRFEKENLGGRSPPSVTNKNNRR